jgi:RNA polymerase sigma-70 factor (ECF subfamily)
MSRPNSAHSAREQLVAASSRDGVGSVSTSVPVENVWRTHLVWLRTRLRGRFSADLADDLAQETYLRMVSREASAPAENPRGLLMTVASNLARDTFRRDRVRADYAARAPQTFSPGHLSGHTAEDDFEVREAIRALPPNLRDVLLLSKIGGLTNREIAQRYGLSVRAIDKRLQKAVTLFVARLRD